MDFVNANGLTIHYRLLGDPTASPAIVFSNSLGTDFRIWDTVKDAFLPGYALLFYDKRGHGLSDAPSAPYAMQDHVEDVAALMDHLGLSKAVLCGLSVGGMIAQGLSARRPDLVRALILCDTAHRIGTHDLWSERIAAIETVGLADIADGILERWFSADFRREQPDALAGSRNMLLRTTTDGYVGTCCAIRDTDFTDVARRIEVPTLCVVGDQDGSTPPDLVRSLADLIPGSRYSVISGAAHLPCIERPDILANVMLGFLNELP